MSTATPPRRTTDPLQLRVSGMHCAGCAATVQRAIETHPEVRSASVSMTDGLARVEGDSLDTDAIIDVIRRRGFDAETVTAAESPAVQRTAIELRQNAAAAAWRRRAIVGMSVWGPMAVLHWFVHAEWAEWALAAGGTVVLATAGAGFYRSAFAAARRGTTNMDTLIALGATTAYVASAVTIVGGLVGPLYFTEAAALLWIISLGHWLETRATARAGSAVRELLELQPDVAERLDADGSPRSIATADVRPSDRILVRPGGRIAVDGCVVEGRSDVDESAVTGEPVPVEKNVGDLVIAGATNTTGRLVIEASVDGCHTTVARIAEIVQAAQTSKADVQRLADRVCSVFVPTVLTIAAITFAGWWITGDPRGGVVATVTVLVISCPCALGLATPMAVMVGVGAASRRGILMKSAAALEAAGGVRRVVFDKTGTLTAGRPRVTHLEPVAGVSETELLGLAASVEAPSEHPIGRAIVDAAAERGLGLTAVDSFEAIPGHGVRGIVESRSIEVLRHPDASCEVRRDDKLIGTLSLEDTLRPDAVEAVRGLRDLGLEVRLLSGDRRAAAESIASRVGLDATLVAADVLPEAKGRWIADLGEGTAMVGDGINDAAALAQASVGIAVASGTTVAIESADVVIPSERLTAVVETIRLSRLTLAAIRQNLFFAFFYNAAAIPAAAFGLLGSSGPIIAAAAMGLSDLTVVGNALRLRARLSRRG